MKETISHKLVKRGMDLWNFRMLRADNITVITCFFEIPETLDDEDDRLELDSVRDWAKAGLRMKGPHPEEVSLVKPPLRRRQACPKLSSLENYNMDYCKGKDKRRGTDYRFPYWIDSDLGWHTNSLHQVPRVKTCSCSKVKNGVREVQARARHSSSSSKSSGSKVTMNKIMYPRPRVGEKRALDGGREDETPKKLKLDDGDRRRDSIQAGRSPDSSSSDIDVSPCSAGADCINHFQKRQEKPVLSPPLPSENSPNSENVELMTPSPSRRKSVRRSPRIQAAALTIPKSRRSCRIR